MTPIAVTALVLATLSSGVALHTALVEHPARLDWEGNAS